MNADIDEEENNNFRGSSFFCKKNLNLERILLEL